MTTTPSLPCHFKEGWANSLKHSLLLQGLCRSVCSLLWLICYICRFLFQGNNYNHSNYLNCDCQLTDYLSLAKAQIYAHFSSLSFYFFLNYHQFLFKMFQSRLVFSETLSGQDFTFTSLKLLLYHSKVAAQLTKN